MHLGTSSVGHDDCGRLDRHVAANAASLNCDADVLRFLTRLPAMAARALAE